MLDEKPRYSISEVLSLLGVSAPTLYRRMREGKLRVVKDGRRSFVMRQEFERYLAACDVRD